MNQEEVRRCGIETYDAGDPGGFCHERIADLGYDTEIIPGVTSFCAAAAALNIPLCENRQEVHIIPGTYRPIEALGYPGVKVFMEMADCCEDGTVYAVEREEACCALIEKNKRHLGISNVTVVPGTAPDALRDLPAPTHAFIGGSNGKLKDILALVLERNPQVRIVLNTVTAETFAEAVEGLKTLPVKDLEIAQISVARSRKLGKYHLMTALNPVFILSCTGGAENA